MMNDKIIALQTTLNAGLLYFFLFVYIFVRLYWYYRVLKKINVFIPIC